MPRRRHRDTVRHGRAWRCHARTGDCRRPRARSAPQNPATTPVGGAVHIIEEFADETAQLLWSDSVVDGRIEWMSAVANRLPMMVVAQLLRLPHDDVDE